MGCTASKTTNVPLLPDQHIPPSWKETTSSIATSLSGGDDDDETDGVLKVPVKFAMEKYKQAYIRTTLLVEMQQHSSGGGEGQQVAYYLDTGGRALTLKTRSIQKGSSGGLMDQVLAVGKRKGGTFRLYRPQNLYEEQPQLLQVKSAASDPLYHFATVSSLTLKQKPWWTLYYPPSKQQYQVSFVHQQPDDPATYIIDSGPMNSFEKYLLVRSAEDGQPPYYRRVAVWKYQNQQNRVEITEAGHDVGLVILLVVIADLMDVDNQMTNLRPHVMVPTA